MPSDKLKKLAKRLAFEENTAETAFVENEGRISDIENVQKDIEIVKDDAQELVTAIAELDQKKADKEDVAQQLENIARMPGRPGNPGPPGKDYILTPKDKEEIANKIKVPVVEKVIERTEVIKEQPIIKTEVVEKTLETIKEVAKYETPQEIRDKLSSLSGTERLDAKHIKNLPESKIVYQNSGGVSSIKGLRAGTNIAIDNTNVQYPVISSTSSVDLSGYVPYTGATTNVNLGTNYITSTAFILPEGAYFENPTIGLQNTKWTGNVFYFDGLELAMQGNTISNANIPNYTPTTRTLTINGTAYDLSADRSWTVGSVDGTGTANQVAYWSDSNTITGGTSNTIVNGTTPETRLTETTNSEYTRLTKLGSASSYVATRLNRVNVPGGTNAINATNTGSVASSGKTGIDLATSSADNPWSISVWINPSSVTNVGVLDISGDTGNVLVFLSGNVYIDIYGTTGYLERVSAATISTSTWTHLIITYDGSGSASGINIYKNNSLTNSTATTSGYTHITDTGGGNVKFGSDNSSGSRYTGKIQEVVFYDYVINSTERGNLYNAGAGSYTSPASGIQGLWHFEEGSGLTSADSSGNGNTVTLNSATWTSGLIPSPGGVTEVQTWKSQSGTNASEQGIHTWGNSAGRSVIAGDARIELLTTNGLVYTSGGAGKLYTHAGLGYDDTTRTLNLNTLAGAGALKINDSTFYSTLDFIPTSVRGWRMMTGGNSTDGIDLTTYVSSSNGSVASLTAVMKLTNNGIVFGAGVNTVSGNGNLDVKGGTINLGDAYATGSAGSWGTKLRLGNTNNAILHIDTSTVEGAVSVDTTNSSPYNSMQIGTLTNHHVMIKTNGTSRLLFDTSGNIIAGIAFPTYTEKIMTYTAAGATGGAFATQWNGGQQMMMGGDDSIGAYFASHTGSDGKSTYNAVATRIGFSGGFAVLQSAATTAGSTRTWRYSFVTDSADKTVLGVLGTTLQARDALLNIGTTASGKTKMITLDEPTFTNHSYAYRIYTDDGTGLLTIYGVNASTERTNPIIAMNRANDGVQFYGPAVFNESGGDNDFRVETDNYDALFADASNDSIMLMSNAAGKVGFYGTTAIVQPTTAVAEATFVENAGGVVVNDDSTFDGYTMRQVVKALRNYGLLA